MQTTPQRASSIVSPLFLFFKLPSTGHLAYLKIQHVSFRQPYRSLHSLALHISKIRSAAPTVSQTGPLSSPTHHLHPLCPAVDLFCQIPSHTSSENYLDLCGVPGLSIPDQEDSSAEEQGLASTGLEQADVAYDICQAGTG